MKQKRFAMLFTTLLLVLSLASGACASTLARSEQYEVFLQAREIMYDTYGFDIQTLSLFTPIVSKAEDGLWEVEFSPIKYGNRMGSYKLTLKDGKLDDISWSKGLDEKQLETLASASLDFHTWGAMQIKEALTLDLAASEKQLEIYQKYSPDKLQSMEAHNELAQWYRDNHHPESVGYFEEIILGENELAESEAIGIAKETLARKYGLSDDEMENDYHYSVFASRDLDGNLFYQISADQLDPTTEHYMSVYFTTVDGFLGKAVESYCVRGAWDMKLPEGPLDEYGEYVQEFFDRECFAYYPYDEKADVAQRLEDAGFEQYLQEVTYRLPTEDELSADEVMDLFKIALEEKRGITEDMLVLFDIQSSLVTYHEPDKGIWIFRLVPANLTDFFSYWSGLGEYIIHIDSKTGKLLLNEWTYDYFYEHQTPTKKNWGSMQGWNGNALVWLLELREQLNKIGKNYGFADDIPGEVLARVHELHRENGFDPSQYNLSLPGADDLTEEEAVAIARQVLMEDCGVDPDEMDKWVRVFAYFGDTQAYAASGDENTYACWQIHFYPGVPGEMETYSVYILGSTGEITLVDYVIQGNG